jgi:hypothetical protein
MDVDSETMVASNENSVGHFGLRISTETVCPAYNYRPIDIAVDGSQVFG